MSSRLDEKMKPVFSEGRRHCLACGAELPSMPVLSFHNMPASAQHIPDEEEVLQDRGIDLRLYECSRCGLSQFDCDPVDYYRDVIRAVGLSRTMKELRREDYRHLVEDYGLAGGKFIECGCGRGEFLEVLKEFPVRIFGIEADPVSSALAAGSLNICETCGTRVPGSIKKDGNCNYKNIGICDIKTDFPERGDQKLFGAPFDCFLSFNFLEHQPDPSAMLSCMYANLRPGGLGLITVPSFEYILEQGYYYEFIRDHIANYDLHSLESLVKSCGFEILEEGRIGIGDTLRMVVRKPEAESASGGASQRGAALAEEKSGIKTREAGTAAAEISERETSGSRAAETRNTAYNYDKFEKIRDNQKNIADNIKKFTEKLAKEGKTLALWGAGHQGFTIASTTALSEAAEYIIDSAAFKQGRFAPASHLPIVSPRYFLKHPTDVVMIAAPGYIKEIKKDIEVLCAENGEGVPEITDILSI